MKGAFLVASLFWGLWANAVVVVISDIDDTIKKSNGAGYITERVRHLYLKKVYPEIRDIYWELSNEAYLAEGVDFFYVSAAFDITFDKNRWLEKHGFPKGETFLRKLGSGSVYAYKKKIISSILARYQGMEKLKLFFFGDNSSEDERVYTEIVEEFDLDDAGIFIRDVKTISTYFGPGVTITRTIRPGVDYFLSERELLENRAFDFISPHLRHRIDQAYRKRTLIPEYTFLTFQRRLKREKCRHSFLLPLSKSCVSEAKDLSEERWEEYHRRF